MATQPITYPDQSKGDIVTNDILLAKWTLGNGDNGAALKGGNFSDQNIHFHGTFSTGGSVQLRGSNMETPDPADASHWFIVRTAHDGSDISGVTTFYGAVILESVLWLSPLCTAGDGSTAIECSIKSNKRK